MCAEDFTGSWGIGRGGELRCGWTDGVSWGMGSASRMNSVVVIFLDKMSKVERLVEDGVVLRDPFTPVCPLVNPARKVTVSNAPPLIKNDDPSKALSRYGHIVSPIKMGPVGYKLAKIQHVACHRRPLFMIPEDVDSHINLTLNLRIDGFNYVVFITSDTMKCFGCGKENGKWCRGFGLEISGGWVVLGLRA